MRMLEASAHGSGVARQRREGEAGLGHERDTTHTRSEPRSRCDGVGCLRVVKRSMLPAERGVDGLDGLLVDGLLVVGGDWVEPDEGRLGDVGEGASPGDREADDAPRFEFILAEARERRASRKTTGGRKANENGATWRGREGKLTGVVVGVGVGRRGRTNGPQTG
jgi:hypothetical protein